MNDSDICKRIAEIEGKGNCFKWFESFAIRTEMYAEREEYNPLTDDALCFKLMVKYRIDFSTLEGSGKHYASWALHGNLIEENPNKAVCLAIIELKKRKINNE